jgi:E3 ubiquitin-protein ligase MYCBP2
VCPSCAGGALAASCSIHGKEFIEYKCAFCCNVSTWFCWGASFLPTFASFLAGVLSARARSGKTHFCDECHARQQRGDYMNKKPRSELPVCPGPEKCPLRRPHPPNGEEFSLGCALCANQNSF